MKLTVKMLFTCIAGAFTIMHKKATIVIYLVHQSTPTYINEMAGYSIITYLRVTGRYICFGPLTLGESGGMVPWKIWKF